MSKFNSLLCYFTNIDEQHPLWSIKKRLYIYILFFGLIYKRKEFNTSNLKMEKEKIIHYFFLVGKQIQCVKLCNWKNNNNLIEHFKVANFTIFVALVGDSTMARLTLAA